MVGDIRGSSCDLEAFFVSIFQARSVIRDPPASSLAVVQLFCYRLLGSGKIPKFMYNRKHPWLAIWTTSVKQFGTKITLIIAECREILDHGRRVLCVGVDSCRSVLVLPGSYLS